MADDVCRSLRVVRNWGDGGGYGNRTVREQANTEGESGEEK